MSSSGTAAISIVGYPAAATRSIASLVVGAPSVHSLTLRVFTGQTYSAEEERDTR